MPAEMRFHFAPRPLPVGSINLSGLMARSTSRTIYRLTPGQVFFDDVKCAANSRKFCRDVMSLFEWFEEAWGGTRD